MSEAKDTMSLLLVDNDPEFHRTANDLRRIGFEIHSATGEVEALRALAEHVPDILVLDIAAGGLQTLRKLRTHQPDIPAIVLARHSGTPSSLHDLNTRNIQFVGKPIDLDDFLIVLRKLKSAGKERAEGTEHQVRDLMVSPDLYPRLYTGELVRKALGVLAGEVSLSDDEGIRTRLRSAILYDERGVFVNMIRLNDLLAFLDSPHLGEGGFGYTGMFLARCSQLMELRIGELIGGKPLTVDANAPLMEAVHLMVTHKQINLPVLERGVLVGVIRDKNILIDAAEELGLFDE